MHKWLLQNTWKWVSRIDTEPSDFLGWSPTNDILLVLAVAGHQSRKVVSKKQAGAKQYTVVYMHSKIYYTVVASIKRKEKTIQTIAPLE